MLANQGLVMQTQYNIHEAKTRLSQIIEQVESGGEAVIARAGKPVARLVPITTAPSRRVLGQLAGQFKLPTDDHQPLPETPAAFIDAIEGR